jgi:hypothetical protein
MCQSEQVGPVRPNRIVSNIDFVQKMADRNDEAISNAMIAMTQAITQANAVAAGLQNNQGAADELGMDHPLQDRPPTLCFHCREQGHISTKCEKPKKELKTAQTSTRVFVLKWEEEEKDPDNLVQGTCSFNNVPSITINDTRATQSFIVIVCAREWGLE